MRPIPSVLPPASRGAVRGASRRKLALPVLAAVLLAACGATDQPDPTAGLAIMSLPNPSGPGSGEPNLTAGPAGVYLSWLERSGDASHALRFSRWQDTAWGEPRTVIDRSGLFVNWADFPSMIALDDGTLAAHWLEKSGPGTYAYDVRIALSADGGETWSDDIVPHRDGLQAEHGFVALFRDQGEFGAVWLDGRETVEGGPMTLRTSRVAPDGSLGAEVLLDESVCDCCQTGVAVGGSGPIVVYRDRTEDEIRDISVVRRVDGRWTSPRPVHGDGWRIEACPVNGPAIAAAGSRVAVAWFTGAPVDGAEEEAPAGRVLAAFSDDGGAGFGTPVRIDDGAPLGRVDLVLLPDGSALVAWLERTAEGADIRLRHVPAASGGARTRTRSAAGPRPGLTVAATAASRPSGFPRMAAHGDRLFFAWTETGEAPVIRTATAPIGERAEAGGGS